MKQLIMVLAALCLAGCSATADKQEKLAYDSADGIYKFIPVADKTWTDQFGDNHKTRMVHSQSELRVVVADQGRRLLALTERVTALEPVVDPNTVDHNKVKE